MNYRRGLQRVYLVLSVLWFGSVVALAFRDQAPATLPADFFSATPPPANQTDWSQFSAAPPASTPSKTPSSFVPDPKPHTKDTPPTTDIWDVAAASATPKANHSLRDYWISRTTLAALPPIGGYLVFFITVPWVARGFIDKPKD